MLEFVALLPHPPVVIKKIGAEETDKIAATAKAMEKVATEIKLVNPDVIVVITPHGPVFEDAVTITGLELLRGDLSQFGAHQESVEFKFDHAAADKIAEHSQKGSVPCFVLDSKILQRFGCSEQLDHGLVVPLLFVSKAGWQGNIIPINIAMLSYKELYKFGHLLREALDGLGRKWILLISGDMSHRLLPGSPAGYSPQGAKFDKLIRKAILAGDAKKILELDTELIESAGECVLRPLIMGLGALDGYEIRAEELSYEGPFGVGYLVAVLRGVRKNNPAKSAVPSIESLQVQLARESIRHYLSKGEYMLLPDKYLEFKNSTAGVFVSLKKQGNLRGCIGTIEPQQANMGQEIIYNAVSAALGDPRFEPLQEAELDKLEISVDVLAKPEKIEKLSELNPAQYGVIVTRGTKRGLLLPDIEGISDANQQVDIARAKAGIRPEEEVSLERFKVTRYT